MIINSVSDYDSMDELIKEIEKEEAAIVITKDIRKYRKPVTVISGLQERKDLKDITKQLKTKIGTGGTFKEGQIILQGDHREAAKGLLAEMGFKEEAIEVY
jgi:translation initiation factor 1